MKEYEVVVLLHPDLEIDLDKPLKKVEEIIKEQKGKIAKTDVWGKRKLAYPINKEDFAVYVYYELTLPPENVRKLETAFNLADEVIRYLVTYPVPVIEEEKDDKNQDETEEKPKSKSKSTAKATAGKDE